MSPVIHSNPVHVPTLSAPVEHVEDAQEDATPRAIIFWSPANGTYQWLEIGSEHTTQRHLRALVNGVQEVSDTCALWYRFGGEWQAWQD